VLCVECLVFSIQYLGFSDEDLGLGVCDSGLRG